MIEWNEMHQQIRDMVRRFVETEIKPHLEELEHGDTPPYAVLRKMVNTFGLGEMAKGRFLADIERQKRRAAAAAAGEATEPKKEKERKPSPEAANEMAMQLIPIIELARYSPGMITALGVSMGLAGRAITSKGTIAQQERWGLPLLTLEKIGAWAITEPGSGSDAFGAMKS